MFLNKKAKQVFKPRPFSEKLEKKVELKEEKIVVKKIQKKVPKMVENETLIEVAENNDLKK